MQAIGLLHPEGPAAAAADEAREAAEAQRAAEAAAQLKNPARLAKLGLRHSSGIGLDGLGSTPRVSSMSLRHPSSGALAAQANGGFDPASGTDADDFQVCISDTICLCSCGVAISCVTFISAVFACEYCSMSQA